MSDRGKRKRSNRPRTRGGPKPKLYTAGNPDGLYNYAVVANNVRAAADRMGLTVYSLQQHGGEVGPADDKSLRENYAPVLDKPGTVFRRSCQYTGREQPPWEEAPQQPPF